MLILKNKSIPADKMQTNECYRMPEKASTWPPSLPQQPCDLQPPTEAPGPCFHIKKWIFFFFNVCSICVRFGLSAAVVRIK